MNNKTEIEKEIENSYEYGLPEFLVQSIEDFKNGQDSLIADCWYCNLQSDINVAEGAQVITTDQAWFLREKYLGLRREDNS